LVDCENNCNFASKYSGRGVTNRYQLNAYISNNNLKMKNVLICILVLLCAMPISAQRNKKQEAKAKTIAEKYERVGNELTISFVEENIPMSKQDIYADFPTLLEKQFKISYDEIESRDPLSKSVTCSLTRKVLISGNVNIMGDFKVKLEAKEGKARISVQTDGYKFYEDSRLSAEEPVCSRPPFEVVNASTDKVAKLNEFYLDAFIQLDKAIDGIIKDFSAYCRKLRK